jgi:hypothetical protein
MRENRDMPGIIDACAALNERCGTVFGPNERQPANENTGIAIREVNFML